MPVDASTAFCLFRRARGWHVSPGREGVGDSSKGNINDNIVDETGGDGGEGAETRATRRLAPAGHFEAFIYKTTYDHALRQALRSGTSIEEVLEMAPVSDKLEEVKAESCWECHRNPVYTYSA